MSVSASRPTRILILGGGFGGVAAAQGLVKLFRRTRAVEVTLVSRDNHFVFSPLLASAAAGTIETLHVVAPIREMIKGARFRQEEVLQIDLARQAVVTGTRETARERELPYDHLVLALGNVINLSRLPGVAQHGLTLKTLGDAYAIRNRVLRMLEMADIETDPAARREMLSFVVAGGGFSGVEMVGELNDLVREALHQYPSISREQVRVILLHSQERILPEMSAEIADYALRELRKRGVEVRLKARLAGATPHEALLQGGSSIATRTLIVAVGNAPPVVLDDLDVAKDRGRIIVDPFMRLPDYPNVWALGDNAIVPNSAAKDGAASPPTAQYALRQGKQLAANIARAMRREPLKPFAFGGLGLLCLVGHGAGVGELPGGIRVQGRLGWFFWRGVYWSKLPTVGRRIQIGASWLLDPLVPIDTAQIDLARTQVVNQAHFDEGAYIFRQGDPADHFYLIASGEVEVIREHSSGEHEVLRRLGQGDYFGETALLTRQPRNASIRCTQPTDVITLGRDDFATLASTWLQFATNLRATSDQRLQEAPLTTFYRLNVTAASGAIAASQNGREAMSYSGPGGPVAARLVRTDSGGEIALDRDLISIGRSADNHIPIQGDSRASRRHALIQRDNGDYWIEDIGASNGTFVNGTRIIERVRLQDGDEITIGATEFRFLVPPLPLAPPTSVATFAPLDTPAPPTPPFAPPPPPVGVPNAPASDESASITSLINTLDAPDAAKPPAPPRPPDSITGILEGLEQPRRQQAPPPPASATPPPPPAAAPAAEPVVTTPASQQPVTRAILQVLAGPAMGTIYEVHTDGGVLGRSQNNEIAIPDERLSRRHAEITYNGGSFWIQDLGSLNGTIVNAVQLAQQPQQLRHGDEIAIGDTRIAVSLDAG